MNICNRMTTPRTTQFSMSPSNTYSVGGLRSQNRILNPDFYCPKLPRLSKTKKLIENNCLHEALTTLFVMIEVIFCSLKSVA